MNYYAPWPRHRQPPWLRELFQVITCYPPHPETGCGAALCRWCDLTWPLPLATFEAHPEERARFVAAVSSHGIGHAVAGDLWLDATTGEPLDDDAEDDYEEDER